MLPSSREASNSSAPEVSIDGFHSGVKPRTETLLTGVLCRAQKWIRIFYCFVELETDLNYQKQYHQRK